MSLASINVVIGLALDFKHPFAVNKVAALVELSDKFGSESMQNTWSPRRHSTWDQ
jgi:hypothetical protein